MLVNKSIFTNYELQNLYNMDLQHLNISCTSWAYVCVCLSYTLHFFPVIVGHILLHAGNVYSALLIPKIPKFYFHSALTTETILVFYLLFVASVVILHKNRSIRVVFHQIAWELCFQICYKWKSSSAPIELLHNIQKNGQHNKISSVAIYYSMVNNYPEAPYKSMGIKCSSDYNSPPELLMGFFLPDTL